MSRRWAIILAAVAGCVSVLIAAVILIQGVGGQPSAEVDGPATATGGQMNTEADDDFGQVAVYRVSDGGQLTPEPSATASEAWELFVAVATPEFVARGVTEYRAGQAPESDTLAYVRADERDPTRWIFAANLAFANDRDLFLGTLIHEYAHILSLDPTQMQGVKGACPTLQLDEGCLVANSPLLAFDHEFWTAYGEDVPSPDSDDADAAAELYAAYPDDFVSDYAATNVIEDFAESFMTFVVEDRPDSDGPVALKLLFFWGLPDYVATRERIRTATQIG